jgi:hypothetical protein
MTMAYGATGDGATGYDDDDDGDDKEVDGNGTRRSFQGGTMKVSLSRESRGPQRRRGRCCCRRRRNRGCRQRRRGVPFGG